jgi:hypothetical protein
MATTNAQVFFTSSAHFEQQAMCLSKKVARSGDRVLMANASATSAKAAGHESIGDAINRHLAFTTLERAQSVTG